MMKKIRLLIIEEHSAVRNALQIRLQSSSTLEVIAAFQTVADWKVQPCVDVVPDVVLLGIKRSGNRMLNTTINDIKEFRQRGTAVIVLASIADDIERELFFQAGAQSYLLKDINSNQLIKAIEMLAAAHPG